MPVNGGGTKFIFREANRFEYSIEQIMCFKINLSTKATNEFVNKLLKYSSKYDYFCFLNSNNYSSQYQNIICGLGKKSDTKIISSLNETKEIFNSKKWYFGHLTYDVKNSIENLESNHFDGIQFPKLNFYEPEYLIKINDNKIEIKDLESESIKKGEELFTQINNHVEFIKGIKHSINLTPRINKSDYLKKVKSLQAHIQKGDIYEVNFCQEFYNENAIINPIELYLELNKKSPAPFSCFYKNKDKYLVSASPERFLQKKGKTILSQPIKGTAARYGDKKQDEYSKKELLNNQKELSENIMITDLVRNDLSKITEKSSINVTELNQVYEFPAVFQLISTIEGCLKQNILFEQVIKAAFPPGSMTGAPKMKSMELIENHEVTQRNLYSGSVGYITPIGDFDFNVVIRSFLYNAITNYLSLSVGGAITAKSKPEDEYQECLLKVKAIREVLLK